MTGAGRQARNLFQLSAMVQRGLSRILIDLSFGGFLPIPNDAAYAASNAFGPRSRKALGLEMRDTSVSVTVKLFLGHISSRYID